VADTLLRPECLAKPDPDKQTAYRFVSTQQENDSDLDKHLQRRY